MPTIKLTPEQIAKMPRLSIGNQKFCGDNWIIGEEGSKTLWKDTPRDAIEINGKFFKDATDFSADFAKVSDTEKMELTEKWIKRELFKNDDVLHSKVYPSLFKFYSQSVAGHFMTQMMMSVMANSYPNGELIVYRLKENEEHRTCLLTYENGILRAKVRHTGFIFIRNENGIQEVRNVPGSCESNLILTDQGFKLESLECSNPLIVELATKSNVDCKPWLDAIEDDKDKEQALFDKAKMLLAQTAKAQEALETKIRAHEKIVEARKKARKRVVLDDYQLLERSLRAYLHYLINKVAHYLQPSELEVAIVLMHGDRKFLTLPMSKLTEEQAELRQDLLERIIPERLSVHPAAQKLKLVLALRDKLHQPDASRAERLQAAREFLTLENRAILNRHRDRFSQFLEKVFRSIFPNKLVDRHFRLFQSKGQRRVLALLNLTDKSELKEKQRRAAPS